MIGRTELLQLDQAPYLRIMLVFALDGETDVIREHRTQN